MTVEVPPGIESGQHLQYDGYGEASADGGPPGDLYVRVLVAEHEHFVREGCDLRLRLPVAIWQAALGDTVRIPTLEREVEFEIPAGVQSGEEIRLPGKGLPGLRSRSRGDQIVTITVTTPQDLTPDQRRLFEELAQAFGDRVPKPRGKGVFGKVREVLGGE